MSMASHSAGLRNANLLGKNEHVQFRRQALTNWFLTLRIFNAHFYPSKADTCRVSFSRGVSLTLLHATTSRDRFTRLLSVSHLMWQMQGPVDQGQSWYD